MLCAVYGRLGRIGLHAVEILGGRSRRFDFLGYRFSAAGLAVAGQTVERCMAKVSQLDEHGAATRRIGIDVQRWEQWVRAGLRGGNRALERWGGADSVS